jgi:hypothetical protein
VDASGAYPFFAAARLRMPPVDEIREVMIATMEQGSSTQLPLFHCQYHQCSHRTALDAYSASESVELPGSLFP